MDSMYKVCIRSHTFNHAQYIEDAMNGFVMQETLFPFVAAIVDDASTDNAQQVIISYFEKNFDTEDSSIAFQEETEYGKVLFARHNTNKNCYFAIVLLKENHYRQKKSKLPYISRWMDNAKYIAICEGDDYWTESLKLQRQVEFLESHPEIGLCYTDYDHLNQGSHVLTSSMFEEQNKYHTTSYERFLLKSGFLAPMTWLYRNDLSDLIKNATIFSDGTYAYMLEFMQKSQVSYLPFVTATYRSHVGSASSPANDKGLWSFFKGVYDTQVLYSQKYPCSEDLRQKVRIQGYLRLLPIAIKAEQHAFVKEARDFFESLDMDISLIIQEIEEGERRKRSYAYRIGKKLVSPFSFLRKQKG